MLEIFVLQEMRAKLAGVRCRSTSFTSGSRRLRWTSWSSSTLAPSPGSNQAAARFEEKATSRLRKLKNAAGSRFTAGVVLYDLPRPMIRSDNDLFAYWSGGSGRHERMHRPPGSPRTPDEGTRTARTVRRPPRGVPKVEFASQDWHDVVPDAGTQPRDDEARAGCRDARPVKRVLPQLPSAMAAPPARDAIALLAALSHGTDFSVGCYCEDEACCHRSPCGGCWPNTEPRSHPDLPAIRDVGAESWKRASSERARGRRPSIMIRSNAESSAGTPVALSKSRLGSKSRFRNQFTIKVRGEAHGERAVQGLELQVLHPLVGLRSREKKIIMSPAATAADARIHDEPGS